MSDEAAKPQKDIVVLGAPATGANIPDGVRRVEVAPVYASPVSTTPTWEQLSAKNLAWTVLIAILLLLLIFMLTLHWTVGVEDFSSAKSLTDTEYARFKELNDLAWSRVEKTLQYGVGTVLLPLLTLFVGYAFGRGAAARGSSDGS